MPKSKTELDRELYQYQRQLDAPKIFSESYPNISKAVDPYILNKTDQEIYNKLGENTDNLKGDTSAPQKAFRWYRDAENNASTAMAKDYYKETDPKALLQKIKEEKGLDFATGETTNPDQSGAYNLQTNTLTLNKGYPEDILDTVVHETGHADDFKKRPIASSNLQLSENNDPATWVKNYVSNYKNDNLYDTSNMISNGHFLEPRSHSINEMINKSVDLGKSQGLERFPDLNPQYDSLNYIKPELKQLQGYDPSSGDLTMFQKLKRILNK